MSNQNNTRFLLNIKDPNIIFSDNSVRKEIVKGIECNVVTASLSPSNPKHCMHCGCINTLYSIIKNGSKTVTLRLNRCSGITTYLKLKKCRFYCKNCKRTFIDQCSIVKPNCSITTSVYHQVILDIKTKQSVLDIAKRNDVSHTTVNSWIHSINDSYVPSFKHLPKTIQTAMDTLRYHSISIINALTYSYSNGKLEEADNLIKVIKRITFGYRLFSTFRARILLICNTRYPYKYKNSTINFR